MKGHETKMPRMEDILNLAVQDPPYSTFSAADIKWIKIEGGRQGGDDIAVIPFARVEDFVKGESSNAECPASFRIESKRKRAEGSVKKPRVDGYLEYTLYWCSYGPEDYRDIESGPSDGSNVKPSSGKGSRPGRRHMMRGCLCHFTVKRLYVRPVLALIIYNQRKHVDKRGAPCHGILDQDAVGTRAMYAPRISDELRQNVMSMLYAGMTLDTIIQHQMEVVESHGGPKKRDDFLTRNDVRNMERVIRNSSHSLHENDVYSMKLWVQRHRKHVFFFQENSSSHPFLLGLQTDWQLQRMLNYGHNGSIASHSILGSKKLKYQLCTLLVFDSSRNAIPVAWVIASSFTGQGSHSWIGPLAERIRSKDPRWRPYAFLVDNPSLEISIIRESFLCQTLLSTWHVRRTWLKSLLKKCCNSDVRREMFKHLGWILYCTKSRQAAAKAVEEFMQVYVDQRAFMDYFKRHWLPHIEFWVDCTRSHAVSNPQPHASIESYHLRLKLKLFNMQYSIHWQRIDWLIQILTTEFHSLYWLEQYMLETGYFENLKGHIFSSNSWYQALLIPDIDVILDEQNPLVAKVISQTDRSLTYTIWNPGSEFSICDCSWSRLGNLCKHIIKVAMLCKSRRTARPLLAAQAYQETLLALLQNPPDLVLDHAIVHASRLQQDIKSLEDLSNSDMLRPLPFDMNPQMADPL